MAQTVGDILKLTLISELDGVQMSNTIYWEIDDLGIDESLGAGLARLMISYMDQIRTELSDKYMLVCGILVNLTNDRKATDFTTSNGTDINDSHPQDQVLRLNRYSRLSPGGDKVRRGAFNQSGVSEPHSIRGRWTDITKFDLLTIWLTSTVLILGTGWTLSAKLKSTLAIGPPRTFQFLDSTSCQASSRVFKLGTRKTRLCAQA